MRLSTADADMPEVLTTGQVAEICHVAPNTVSKWVDTGRLRGYRIPGSRERRIPRGHLVAFMRAHGLPTGAIDQAKLRVLVVGEALSHTSQAFDRHDLISVDTATNSFAAGAVAQRTRPHVIVIDTRADDPAAFCRAIRSLTDLAETRLVAACEGADDEQVQYLRRLGFDAVLPETATAGDLETAIRALTGTCA
jgi:excisionase family DNA binding protein